MLAGESLRIARACRDMAGRFQKGGRLIVFGTGRSATDAEHVAVEFVHPVIVGKRALPALALTCDVATLTRISRERGLSEIFAHQIRLLASPHDVALGITGDGEDPSVLRGFEEARQARLLTVALAGGDGGSVARSAAVDHCLVAGSDDPLVVKEVQVTAYHVLWELVHVFLDRPGALPP